MDTLQKENRGILEAIQKAIEQQEARVVAEEKKLEALASTNKADLESEQFILNQLKAKLRQKIIALEVPRNPVEIIDVAEPNMRPVSPNLFMNVLLSLGLATGPMLVGIVLIVVGAKQPSPPRCE